MAGLAACQGSGSSMATAPRRACPSLLESIDGPPSQIRTALIGELNTAASDRKVELVGASAQARYRVRGYLSAEKAEGGTKVAYVWDVFDAQNKRAKRLTGTSPVLVSYTSLSCLDKETLARLASSSMDEIAEFLECVQVRDRRSSTAELRGERRACGVRSDGVRGTRGKAVRSAAKRVL